MLDDAATIASALPVFFSCYLQEMPYPDTFTRSR